MVRAEEDAEAKGVEEGTQGAEDWEEAGGEQGEVEEKPLGIPH